MMQGLSISRDKEDDMEIITEENYQINNDTSLADLATVLNETTPLILKSLEIALSKRGASDLITIAAKLDTDPELLKKMLEIHMDLMHPKNQALAKMYIEQFDTRNDDNLFGGAS